jgi:hypothetical protein
VRSLLSFHVLDEISSDSLVSKFLLCTSCVSDTVLGSRDIAMTKNKLSLLPGANSLERMSPST